MPFGKISKKQIWTHKQENTYNRRKYPKKKKINVLGQIIEKKQFDNYNYVTCTNTGNCLYNLTLATVQGVDDGQRVGDSIFCKSMYIKYKVEFSTSVNQTVRVILFIDTMGYNSPVITDLFEPVPLSTAYAPLAQYNHKYMSRFRILHDKLYSMSPAQRTNLSKSLRLTVNKKVEFIGNVTFKNQIWIAIVSDDGNLLSAPTARWYSRMIYLDA